MYSLLPPPCPPSLNVTHLYLLSFCFVRKYGVGGISPKMNICFTNIKFMSHCCFCAFYGHDSVTLQAIRVSST